MFSPDLCLCFRTSITAHDDLRRESPPHPSQLLNKTQIEFLHLTGLKGGCGRHLESAPCIRGIAPECADVADKVVRGRTPETSENPTEKLCQPGIAPVATQTLWRCLQTRKRKEMKDPCGALPDNCHFMPTAFQTPPSSFQGGNLKQLTASRNASKGCRIQGLHCLQMCSFGGEEPADGERDYSVPNPPTPVIFATPKCAPRL